ncbi:unnamed protein product [Auanema sp. JU1783]|nr:unnamed protein product [Auanema sp. JU1783]
MPIQDEIVGKWNLVSSENFDAYLKEVGIGMMTRAVVTKLKPTVEFAINGDEWSMNTVSTFKTILQKWKLGVSADDKTGDGREVNQTFTIEDDKLVQIEKSLDGGKDSKFLRYVTDGKLTVECESNGVKCIRVYEKAK